MSKLSQGEKAEQIACAFERLRVGKYSRDEVKYVGDRIGLGFDIQSRNSSTDSTPRFIEVKSASPGGFIFITERERQNLSLLGNYAWIYLVDTVVHKVIRQIQNPLKLMNEDDQAALIYKIKI